MDFNDEKRRFQDFANRFGPNDAVYPLAHAVVQGLENVNSTEELVQQSGLIVPLALLVILTCCDGTEEPMLVDIRDLHETSWKFFSLLTNGDIGSSKQHFGRPMFRKIDERGELLGDTGTDTSAYLWKHLDPQIVTEVPACYYTHRCVAPVMYLLLTHFGSAILSSEFNAIDVVCLLEVYGASSSNNQKNVRSLLGEYIAMQQVCLRERFTSPDFAAKSETIKFDFSVKKNHKDHCYYSVKSVCTGGTHEFFQDMETINTSFNRWVQEKLEANVVLHDCRCEFCDRNPIWKVTLKTVVSDEESDDEVEDVSKQEVRGLDGFHCDQRSYFSSLIEPVRFGVIYLLTAKTFFELRYAVGTKVKHDSIRGSPFHSQEHLKDALESAMQSAHDGGPQRTIRTFIPR